MPEVEYSIPPETLDWLFDPSDPGPRYLALRHLTGLAPNDPQMAQARLTAHKKGPIAELLDNVNSDGYWAEAGPGYYPKYRGSVWTIITLAQLGASVEEDPRLGRSCQYLVESSMTDIGQFTVSGTPSTTVDCLQGNLCSALVDVGWENPNLEKAFDWLARSITGEGVAPNSERDAFPRYYAGNCGPAFQCGANNQMACAWGAVKCLLALGKCPPKYHSQIVERAIEIAVDFLLGVDPATAAYPCGYAAKPSGNWWKFGFPIFYVTDLLQLVEAVARAGKRDDPRLIQSYDLIKKKQDDLGRWSLEYDYRGKMWVEFGEKKQPNKWVTIRAYQALGATASPA